MGWAGLPQSGIWVALRLGGPPSHQRHGTAEAQWLQSGTGRGRAVGRKASRLWTLCAGPVTRSRHRRWAVGCWGRSLGCAGRYMEGQEQSRPRRRQGVRGTVVTSCWWRKGGLPVPPQKGTPALRQIHSLARSIPPAGASLCSRSVTVPPSGAVGCTCLVWRERGHRGEAVGPVTWKVSVATGT